MIDARSLDWHTHLSGTSTLCTTQGWHGSSGGVAQSCFWVYCRMDLLASIARSEHTLLPTSSWLGTGASVYSYDDGQTFEPDSWCNRVVLLLAETHNLLCDVGESRPTSQSYCTDPPYPGDGIACPALFQYTKVIVPQHSIQSLNSHH